MKIFKNKKRKYIIITSLVSTFIVIGFIITYYNSIPKEEPLIGAYIDGNYSETLPTKGSGYAVEKIVCDNGNYANWDYDKWGINFHYYKKRGRCEIYFKSLESFWIANKKFYVDEMLSCPTMNNDGSISIDKYSQDYGYICKGKDDYGTSYYYRGNVQNNYVYFAGFYWRIIRYNGNGTVRAIYDGTKAHLNGEEDYDRVIDNEGYNQNDKDNAYVGYMYGTPGSSTYGETHANIHDSSAKKIVDDWYYDNLRGTSYENYISDSLFCNDRSFSKNNSGTGSVTIETYYRAYDYHIGNPLNYKMLLTCPQKNDAFTVDDSYYGNTDLTYPIGLITADEALLAGASGGRPNYSIPNYYLDIDDSFWTMTPCLYSNGAVVGDVYDNMQGYGSMGNDRGIKPVINLKSSVLVYGNGTASDPYHA